MLLHTISMHFYILTKTLNHKIQLLYLLIILISPKKIVLKHELGRTIHKW